MFKFITSWDDGDKMDLGLAAMLKQFNIPAIFFIPTTTKLSEDNIKMLAKNFTIGGHTVNHPEDLKQLCGKKLRYEVRANKKWLEGIIKKEIEWFCYPSGRYDQTTINAVKDAGFKYARTVLVMNTDQPQDDYRIATSIHVYPHRKEYGGRPWLEVAKELWEKAKSKDNGVFHLWGHSLEISKFNLWNELEEFFEYIQKDKYLWEIPK